MYDKYVRITKKSKANSNHVIIELAPPPRTASKYGNIFLTSSYMINQQLIMGKIVSAGHKAKEDGIKKGDVVLYDKDSAYGHPPETPGTLIITHCENVIVKVLDELGDDVIPYGNRVIVYEPRAVETKFGELYIPDIAQERSNIVEVIKTGTGRFNGRKKLTKFEVKAGDKAVADLEKRTIITVNRIKLAIIHKDRLLAIVKDD